MKNTLNIKNIKIGEGIPKICVPITGYSEEEIEKQIEQIKALDIDIVEWRADFYQDCLDFVKMEKILNLLSNKLGNKVLLFTFRTSSEGGKKDILEEQYFTLNEFVANTGLVDLMDIELFRRESLINGIVEKIHNKGVKVIISNHEFNQTPDRDTLVKRLVRMQELGADLAKLAVMPESAEDVIVLLEATNEMRCKHTKTPVVTMSMGSMGKISRLWGGVFGSSITFASAGKISAPGQLPAEELKQMLIMLDK